MSEDVCPDTVYSFYNDAIMQARRVCCNPWNKLDKVYRDTVPQKIIEIKLTNIKFLKFIFIRFSLSKENIASSKLFR